MLFFFGRMQLHLQIYMFDEKSFLSPSVLRLDSLTVFQV